MPENPINVLLIDDDEDAYILIRRLLARIPGRQFSVEWAATFKQGLELLAKRRQDVCLLDYRLGSENGLELLHHITARDPHLPVIIMTGADDPRVDLESSRIGAADFLLKDKMDPDSLERSIRFSIRHFEMMRELQASNQQFRLLFDRSLDGILIFDDAGRILEVNEAAARLLGRPAKDLRKMRLEELSTTGERGGFDRMRQQSLGELSFDRADGGRRHLEYSAGRLVETTSLSILRDITHRRNLEREIQEVSEKEQRRLGQDLHDGLGQVLTGLSFMMKALQRKLEARKLPEAEDAGQLVTQMNQATQQARELVRGLCPAALERNDLAGALEQLAVDVARYFSVAVEVSCDPALKFRDHNRAVHLYRIAQESTTNAVKHGKARTINIRLFRDKDQIRLHVRDDGKGFAVGAAAGKGMGLQVMQHRARMIGATLQVVSSPGAGTTVLCSLGVESE